MRKSVLVVAAVLALGGAVASAVPAVAQSAPQAEAHSPLFAPLIPLIGRTWRGVAIGDQPVVDYSRWEWAIGGHAVRITHALADGSYGGETLIFPDRDTSTLIYHYFTSGGFHTTGTITVEPDGTLAFVDTVHGMPGMEVLRSTGRLDETGYHVRSLNEAGEPFGGFDYTDVGDRAVPALLSQ